MASAAALFALVSFGSQADRTGSGSRESSSETLATLNSERGATVTRVSTNRLRPVGPQVVLGEYHEAYAFSPDSSAVAFGISAPGGEAGRIGVRVVSADPLAQQRDISTGIYAAGLAWPEPDRMLALLGVGGMICAGPGCAPTEPPFYATVALLDPVSGDTLGQERVLLGAEEFPCGSIDLRGEGLAVQAERRIYLIDAGLEVSDFRLPRSFGRCAPLAASPDGQQLFVVARDGERLARIEVASSKLSSDPLPSGSGGEVASVAAVGNRRLLVMRKRGPRDGGLDLVDTGRGTVRTIASQPARAEVVGATILTYGGGHEGITAYGATGQRRYRILAGREVRRVRVGDRFAYAIKGGQLAGFVPETGRVRSRGETDFRGRLIPQP